MPWPLLLALLAAPQDPGGPVWRPLLRSGSLEGWEILGPAEFRFLEDGALEGRNDTGRNAFLSTREEFGDFVLELEVLPFPGTNAGIQVRSHPVPGGDHLQGYQIEVDTSERSWSGGLYDEVRRGWLQPLQGEAFATARKALQPGAWNRFRIECDGLRIRSWVNGVACADWVDPLDLSGHIGLQVHGGRGQRVRYREVRILDRGLRSWEPLWNGRDLQGWEPRGGGRWSVEDGVLVGRHEAGDPEHGILLAAGEYGDFSLRAEFQAVRGNSGLYFRCEPVEDPVRVHGFQAEIDPERKVAGLYETGGRGWVAEPDPRLLGRAFRPGDWNVLHVTALGRRLVTHLNGHLVSLLPEDPGRLRGRIGLQVHGGQDVEVRFRALQILGPPRPRQEAQGED